MEQQTYAEIAEVERTHWWYSARRKILEAVLRAERDAGAPAGNALDLGCGTGANLPVVARCGRPIGVDLAPQALAFARARGGYDSLVMAEAGALPFRDGSFAWAFALDVLEHLDDDPAAGEIRRVLQPGGRVVITVPAFPALWGMQDEVAHHRRRYTRRSLLTLLHAAGLRPRRVTYINTALFLPIFLARRTMRVLRLPPRSENTLHPGWANPLLERVFAAEAHLVPRLSLPFGVSLLCVAERPADPSR